MENNHNFIVLVDLMTKLIEIQFKFSKDIYQLHTEILDNLQEQVKIIEIHNGK